MGFSKWFSKRLGLRKNVTASTSTGVVIAVAGVALALVVMELSLAVSAGFKHQIERKVLGFDAPITVFPPYNYETASMQGEMQLSDTLRSIIEETLPGARPVESLRRHAILKTDSDFIAVECFAYGKDHDRSFENEILVRGTITNSDDSIVISSTMARKLGLDTASRAYLYYFIDGKPKVRRASISGIYNSNFGEYDNSVIYTSLPLLQGLADDSTAIGSVAVEGLKFENLNQIEEESQKLQSALVEKYREGEITNMHMVGNIGGNAAVFFNWLDLLDTNVVVIFILMACVAGFTLISSLFIIILDRVATIGILRSLGASKGQVSRIFVNVALRIVGLGMIIGNVIALSVIALQNHTHFLPLDPDMYYLDSVPFELSWVAWLALNVGVAAGAWLILILPARLAARIDPSSSMRYE